MRHIKTHVLFMLFIAGILVLVDIFLYNAIQVFPKHPLSSIGQSSLPQKLVVDYDAAVPPYACPLLLESYNPKNVMKIFTPPPKPVNYGFCLNVPVLLYHHIQPQAMAVAKGQTSLSVDSGIFDQQMAYLSAHYTTINAHQLIDALRSHTPLPQNSMMITLDDGYKDAYDYAFPIFQKYHLTANLMIPTGLLEGPDYLSWGELNQMKGSGLIYLTDHTWSHYSVGGSDVNKIKYEIETGKSQLESRTGQKIDVFTYPYGTFGDTAINILKQDGFVGAYSTVNGTIQCDSFIMTLHRTHIGNAPLSAYGL